MASQWDTVRTYWRFPRGKRKYVASKHFDENRGVVGHPNVVNCYDSGENTESCRGEDGNKISCCAQDIGWEKYGRE